MRKLIILISFTFITNLGFAQNINVKGVVTDAVTGETLPGVNVIVKNSQKGDVTVSHLSPLPPKFKIFPKTPNNHFDSLSNLQIVWI